MSSLIKELCFFFLSEMMTAAHLLSSHDSKEKTLKFISSFLLGKIIVLTRSSSFYDSVKRMQKLEYMIFKTLFKRIMDK